jgi:hypothetical protein
MALVPSTDLVELGGIPFSHTGAKTSDARGGMEYTFSARSALSSSLQYQTVSFDRPEPVLANLRGGHVMESLSAYRYRLDSRMRVGADYSVRRAAVIGDLEQFNIHAAQGAIDYDLAPAWNLTAGLGVVHLQGTALTAARTGPSWRVALDRSREGTFFHVGYIRSYIPSFGFGGTVRNEEIGASFRTPLFHSRHFYTDQSLVFRNDTPLTDEIDQLPLRSLRSYSIFGWSPQPWVRIEAFYTRVQQTSLRPGGRLDRNRIGFQIVTSKPVRIQ